MAARSLTLRHMAKVVRRTREGAMTDPEALGPDQMKLCMHILDSPRLL
jgi:hypothetical protein